MSDGRGLRQLVRPNFHYGQILTDEDMNTLLGWVMGKRRLAGLRESWGVVRGLNLSLTENDKAIQVATGYAVTSAGDDIVVAEPSSIPVPGKRDAKYEIRISPQEVRSQYVPGLGESAADDPVGCDTVGAENRLHWTRVTEAFKITLAEQHPMSLSTAHNHVKGVFDEAREKAKDCDGEELRSWLTGVVARHPSSGRIFDTDWLRPGWPDDFLGHFATLLVWWAADSTVAGGEGGSPTGDGGTFVPLGRVSLVNDTPLLGLASRKEFGRNPWTPALAPVVDALGLDLETGAALLARGGVVVSEWVPWFPHTFPGSLGYLPETMTRVLSGQLVRVWFADPPGRTGNVVLAVTEAGIPAWP